MAGGVVVGDRGRIPANKGESSGAIRNVCQIESPKRSSFEIFEACFCGDSQRALKCYQKAILENHEDWESGDSLCDLMDSSGKESLELAVCKEASEKSPRAFWAFRRLGYLHLHHCAWSQAVRCLQHAIRGFPTCVDLWEALGLAYQRLGMFTAATKSYGRAVEFDDARVFALVESANIFSLLGPFRKGIEQFQRALEISPQNVSANYGLASGLLGLSKECVNLGAFEWGASLLVDAGTVADMNAQLAGNLSCIWKLHGDIQNLMRTPLLLPFCPRSKPAIWLQCLPEDLISRLCTWPHGKLTSISTLQ